MSTLLHTLETENNEVSYSFLSALTLIDQTGQIFSHSTAPSAGRKSRLTDEVSQFDLRDLLSGALHTSGPSRVIPKNLHLLFGEIGADCFTEDIVYLFRSVLVGKVMFSNEETVLYRKHDANMSRHESLYARPFAGVAAQLRADLRVAIEKGFLSSDDAELASEWIEKNVAFRRFHQKKLSGERPFFSDLVSIIRSSHLTFRRKFGIFREYIGIR